MDATAEPIYISVDIETAGPNPHSYALLSIGACLLENPLIGFYIELQPVQEAATEEALAISGLSMQRLRQDGLPPKVAMQSFADWIAEHVPVDKQPIFVAFNAPFDWMFINDYFHRWIGKNPFGHSALDMKAFYMGLHGCAWSETGMASVAAHYGLDLTLQHHALKDAQDQAKLFRHMLEESKRRNASKET